MPTPETVRDSSLPAAVAALSHSLEGQEHPWLLMMLQNLSHRVVEQQQRLDLHSARMDLFYKRLAALEGRKHDA